MKVTASLILPLSYLAYFAAALPIADDNGGYNDPNYHPPTYGEPGYNDPNYHPPNYPGYKDPYQPGHYKRETNTEAVELYDKYHHDHDWDRYHHNHDWDHDHDHDWDHDHDHDWDHHRDHDWDHNKHNKRSPDNNDDHKDDDDHHDDDYHDDDYHYDNDDDHHDDDDYSKRDTYSSEEIYCVKKDSYGGQCIVASSETSPCAKYGGSWIGCTSSGKTCAGCSVPHDKSNTAWSQMDIWCKGQNGWLVHSHGDWKGC